jgi:hypothetical protein
MAGLNVRGPVTQEVNARPLGLLQVRLGPSALHIATNTPVLNSTNSVGALASTKFSNTKEYYKFTSGFPAQTDGQEPTSIMTTIEAAFLEFKPFTFALASGKSPFSDQSAAAYLGSAVSTAGTVDDGVGITVNDDGGVITDEWTVYFTGATAGVIIGKTTGAVHTFSALDSAMAPDNGGNPYFSIGADFFTGTWAAGDIYTFKTTAKYTGSALYGTYNSGSIGLGTGGLPEYLRVEAVQEFGAGHKYTVILPRAQCTSSLDVSQAETEGNIPAVFEGNRADSAISGGNAAWDEDPANGIGPTGRIYFSA